MPWSESSTFEEAISDGLPSSSAGSRALDVFDTVDMLDRWDVTTAATPVAEAGIPAVKYPLGSGESLAMVYRMLRMPTGVNKRLLFQHKLRVDSSTPKVMVGIFKEGSTESSVQDGVWLEKAANVTALKLKTAYHSGTTTNQEASLAAVWPTGAFVTVAIECFCWPTGLVCLCYVDGIKQGVLTVAGAETGKVYVPMLFVTSQSNVWLNQASARS